MSGSGSSPYSRPGSPKVPDGAGHPASWENVHRPRGRRRWTLAGREEHVATSAKGRQHLFAVSAIIDASGNFR